MRFILLGLLLLSQTATAGPREDFWRAKGDYFRALLNDNGDQEKQAAKERLTKFNDERFEAALTEARQGRPPKPGKRVPYVPAHGFHLDELDMIRRSKDLSEGDKTKLVEIFRTCAAGLKKIRAEEASALGALARKKQPALEEKARLLFRREMDVSLKAVEDSAKILVRAGIDRDYVYRAYLREHRRLGIQ